MKTGWIVIRTEKHVDDKYWVCMKRKDALAIAKDVAEYWRSQYPHFRVDRTRYGEAIFSRMAEEYFHVYVIPQVIREDGEIAPQP